LSQRRAPDHAVVTTTWLERASEKVELGFVGLLGRVVRRG
jgi:hypothetical protein